MSQGDRESRRNRIAPEVGKRASTEDYGLGGGQARSHGPGKTSGTEHLLGDAGWSSGLARTRAESVADTLALARRQLASLETVMKGAQQFRAAGQAWVLQGTLRSLEQHLAEAGADPVVLRLRSEAEQLIAHGRVCIAEIQAAKASDSAAAIAQRGIEGDGGPLPHAAQIQASFGRHDISNVRAHVGGASAEANHQLGAQAFALNGQVAFASSPDLHTAAHEAAHVVQQRAGVALKGGIDQPGDEYEQHADLVADAVVRGDSAEPLLDQMAGRGANASRTSATQGMVQRKAAISSTGGNETTNPEYVNKHLPEILSRISDRIMAAGVPQPHPRLNWASYEEGARAVAWAIREYVNAAPDAALKRLMALSSPADMFQIVDGARRAAGGVQEVAAAIAYALDAPIHASIQRVAMRIVVQWDAHGGSLPKASSIVASCPLDGVMAEVLTRRENVVLDFHRKKGSTGSKPFENGVVEVEYEWMGKRDPNLWNWIHVKSPKDATAEHVAKTPLAGGEVKDGSEQAYRIASSPPYFGIPFETAKLVDDAFKYAPPEIKEKLKGHNPGPRVADDTALGNSVISREAALAQAPAPKKTDEAAERTVERCDVQIEYLATELGRWGLAQQLAGARQFIRERKLHIASDPKEAQRWQSVLAMQERILHAASSDVAEIAQSIEPQARVVASGFGFRVEGMQSDAERRAGLAPVIRVLEAYAHAAAVSQLGAQGPAALAKAREARALIPFAMTEQTLQFAGRGMVDEAGSKNEKDDLASYNDLTKRAADMRLKLAQGGNVSPEDQQRLSVESTALATKVRLATLDTQIDKLMKEADRVGEPTADYEQGIPTIRALPHKLQPKLAKWREDVDHTIKANDAELSLQAKEQRIAQVNGALEEFGREAEIKKWFDWAQKHTAHTELNNLINKIGIQIGIMIVTGEIAGAVVAGIRGAALAGELITEVRAASLMLKAGEILIHAGLNTAAQGLTGGPTGGKAFAENALAIVLGHAAMKPFLSLLRNSSAVEQEVIQSWRLFAKNGVKLAIEFTLETGTGIAASAVAHMATYGELSRIDSDEVIVQGISIAASNFVHQRVERMRERIHAVNEQNAEFHKLQERVDALFASTSKDAGKPTREDALRGLIESGTLLHEEAKLYGKQDVGAYANAKDSGELDGSFLDVPLQLRHLSPVVDGQIYEGTAKDVHDAIADINALGIKATVTEDADAGVWRITADEKAVNGSRKRTIEIRKLSEKATHAKPTRAPATTRETQATTQEPAAAKLPAPTRIADEIPRPQDLTPESWMQLQHLMRTHGEKQGLHEWRNLQEGRTADGVSINASIVPGSEFVGTGRTTADPAAVIAKAQQEMPSLANLFSGQVASITPNGRSFAVALQDGTIIQIHVMATQLPYVQVARSQVNTQRGEHTIQLSSRIADEQVQRALAHEVGEIIAETKNAKLHGRSNREDLLGGNSARTEGALSPHDWGRVAELNLLASKLEVPSLAPTERARIRRELTALVEELGLRNDTSAATARRLALVREHALSPEANRALFDAQTGLTKPVSSLPAEDRALVQDVKETAARRDQQELQADERRRTSQLDPLTPTKEQLNIEGRVSLAEQRRIAHVAEQRREQKSAEVVAWLHQLHTSRPPGADYATIEMPVWIGGGASTVGLTPDTLFIDARGRWQQDASANIAQTAQQLSELYGAGMGDAGHFAKPNERVPLDAIRAFEDNLAAQARVVNGYASMTVDQNGRTLLTVTPYHGKSVTVVVGGNRTPVFATGFPRESVPGQRMTLHESVRVLKRELGALGFDPNQTIGSHMGVTDQDAAAVGETLRGSREAAEIEARGSVEAKRALESLLAAQNWESARAHDPKRRRVLRGDEANLVRDFRKTGVHEWVIAGQGGTAISAAEVILNQTRGMKPPVTVRMLGQSSPEGLAKNTQSKEVWKKFGPEGENRLFAEQVDDIGELVVNPNGEATGLSVRDRPNGPTRTIAGEGIIVSMGRAGLLPPPIADHVVEVYNEQHGNPPVPGSSVAGQLLWGANGQYLGYRVVVTRHGKTNTFDVTGAQSRYLPPELFPKKDVRELVAPEWRSQTPAASTAQGRDASATSGNFAGGFGPSATQARDYQSLASEGTIRVMDAEGNFQ